MHSFRLMSHHPEISLTMIYSRGDRAVPHTSAVMISLRGTEAPYGRQRLTEIWSSHIYIYISLESHKNFSPKDKENQDHMIFLHYITVLSNVLSLFNARSQSGHHRGLSLSVPYFCVNKWMSYTLYLLYRWRIHWLSKGIMQIT